MDIKKQRQNYDALQKARAELVRVAVEGIVTNLDGLDLDVCGEILTKSYKRLAGRVMPKGHSGLSAETAESAEKAAENARKAQEQAELHKLPDKAKMLSLYKELFT